jgi:hypothetical protein
VINELLQIPPVRARTPTKRVARDDSGQSHSDPNLGRASSS